jgi:hypothetical protein
MRSYLLHLLKIFSVTTIPSSTMVASTIASNVNTFIEAKNHMIKKVAINDTGISINGLKAIAQSLKKGR